MRDDLVEPVRHDADRGAALGEAAQRGVELLGLERREHGGRLVEEEGARAAVEHAQDLEALALADGERLGQRVERHGEARRSRDDRLGARGRGRAESSRPRHETGSPPSIEVLERAEGARRA